MSAAPALSDLSFEALISLCQKDDKQAIDLMVERNIGLVYACLKRFGGCGRDVQEMYQQGCLGLIKAIKRFDTQFSVRFSTYAVPLILGEIKQFLRNDSPISVQRRDKDRLIKIEKAQAILRRTLEREPTVTELASALRTDPHELMLLMEQSVKPVSLDGAGTGVAIMDTLSDPQGESFIDRLILNDMLSRLPLLEQWLIYLRYEKNSTQAETAKALHMSQVQVSRLEQKLRVKLIRQWNES